MSRMNILANPLLLGFEEIERMIERVGKGADSGYPPYNIERIDDPKDDAAQGPQLLRLTLAIAGFTREDLEITIEDNQLTIHGRQTDDETRQYIHRGIAARQFVKTFVLADGIEVKSADMKNGLLEVDLVRVTPDRTKRRITIGSNTSHPD